jgi:hypothetical protein
VLPVCRDAELRALPYVVCLGPPYRGRFVGSGVQNVDPPPILSVKSADIGKLTVGLDNYSDPVKRLVAWVKDVSSHTQTAAPQYLSNAVVRSAAITWGERPSIW